MATTPIKEVPFTNSIRQVIQPGDSVVIVTSSYGHSTNTARATYLGLTPAGNVKCRVDVPTTKHRLKATGEVVDKYKLHPKYPTRNYGLRWGSPEYNAETTRYNAELDEYQRKIKALDELFEPFKTIGHRHTTLQCNRMFKIDTTVLESAGK